MFFEKKKYFPSFGPLLLLFVLLPGVPQTLFAASASSSETRFVESYATALRAIDSGIMNPSSAKEVHSINSALQKELLSLDRKLEQLKSGSVTADGADRDKILDQLVMIGAERERMFSGYQQQLEQLTAVQAGVEEVPASAVQVAKESASAQAPPQVLEAQSNRHFLQIESVPEDVGEGLFE